MLNELRPKLVFRTGWTFTSSEASPRESHKNTCFRSFPSSNKWGTIHSKAWMLRNNTSWAGEEEEKEETEEKAKEAEDGPFEAPLLYKELKPYVPPIIFPSRLHKSKWNK
ncbi:hypothetical protein QYF36_001245 [Acer negundo]|nr:hypothetical protein QYF36_001245 [Acer negundo]